MKSYLPAILLWILVLSLLAACAPLTAESTPQTTVPQAPSPESSTPTYSVPTAMPTIPTAPTATLAVPQSLTTEELHQRLNPVVAPEEACELPCYVSLIPGEAGLRETLNFFARLGISPQDTIPGDYDTVQDGSGRLRAWLNKTSDSVQTGEAGAEAPLATVRLDAGVVQAVSVGWQRLPPYLAINDILSAFGKPERLELAVDPESEPPTYALLLTYPDRQAGFMFYGRIVDDGVGRMVCSRPAEVSATLFGVFAPEIEPMSGVQGEELLLPLAETLSLSYEDFVADMQADSCISITPEQWQPWLDLRDDE